MRFKRAFSTAPWLVIFVVCSACDGCGSSTSQDVLAQTISPASLRASKALQVSIGAARSKSLPILRAERQPQGSGARLQLIADGAAGDDPITGFLLELLVHSWEPGQLALAPAAGKCQVRYSDQQRRAIAELSMVDASAVWLMDADERPVVQLAVRCSKRLANTVNGAAHLPWLVGDVRLQTTVAFDAPGEHSP